ncbi:hypothetical protein BZG36_03191 [Bifiguratus adelaidae]|uniref:Cytochrome P450 n=1 Tax=Bifiguratus adelaidae TaxID=1938954 RepID=A0A261XYJ2_9FUNG|nr:hypothetical protein BZG36_03191 [Bifiguratus adelaidae]
MLSASPPSTDAVKYTVGAAIAIYIVWKTLYQRHQSTPDGPKPLPQPPMLPILGNIHHLNENIIGRIIGFNFRTVVSAPYGDDWRKYRRIFLESTGMRIMAQKQPAIQFEAQEMVSHLVKMNGEAVYPLHYLQFFAYNIILRIMADDRCDGPSDLLLLEELEAQEQGFALASPVKNPSSLFPILRFLPKSWTGLPLEEALENARGNTERMQRLVDRLRARLEAGEDVQCAGRNLLAKEEAGELDHEEVLGTLGVSLAAGVETSSTALSWWIAELANHPHVQQNIVEEIRHIPKEAGLPEYEVLQGFPHLNASIRETLRLHPPAPFGVPHYTVEDDVYRGYRIEKKRTIIFNIHAMNRDPTRLTKRLDAGENVQCFVRDILEKEAQGELEHEKVLSMMGITIATGYLKEQVGASKFPTNEEALDLPYLNATIRETMRLASGRTVRLTARKALGTAAAVVVAYAIWRYSAKPSQNGAKPLPQPPSLPVFGNVHLIDKDPLKCFEYYSQKLGPIFRFDLGAQRLLIVNDANIAYELTSKRGPLYNSRPTDNPFEAIITQDYRSFASTPYGEVWRKRRRIFMDALGSRRLPKYQEYIDLESQHLLINISNIKQQPTNPLPLIQLFTYNVIIKVLVDERFESPDDPWIVREMEIGGMLFDCLAPTGNLARIFPILRFFPQSWVGYKEEDVRTTVDEGNCRFEVLIDRLKKRLASGEDVQCFVRDILEKEAQGELDHQEVQAMMGVTLAAGYETTASTVTWWIAELANHPEVQAKIYAEMKEKVGTGKYPTHEEALDLPYLNATIRETMRLHPAGPFALPHLVMDDDTYQGYHIPKNHTVIFNVYGMNRDPNRFENPNVFNPDRYLNVQQPSSVLTNGRPEDRDHTSFGFGRRVCAGMHLAERELLAVTSLIASKFILEAIDGPIDTEHYHLGLNMSALPYKVKFIPRA